MSPTPRPESERLYAEATTRIPGGVYSPVRAFKAVGGTPVYFASASGCRVRDADGHELVDLCMSWGPLILGHADARVVATVQDTATRGLSYGACHPLEVRFAELVTSAFPRFDMCRAVNSGTEAVMTALRLARGVTGRPLIVKFDGGYHGHIDSLLVKAGSGLVTLKDDAQVEASSAGVPEGIAATTLVAPLDDLDAVAALFAQYGPQIAAVVIEPLPANNGLLVQSEAFLQGLRDLTSEHGALLIFDEVMTGFRLRFGGYGDGVVGVQPDIVTLGKIVGGGMPVGAVVGPAATMSHLAPAGPVYQAGTLSGNPLSMAAGIATLEQLQANDGALYGALDAKSQRFVDRLAAGGPPWLRARRVGSMVWPYFDEGPLPASAAGVSDKAVARFNAMYRPLLDRGFYLPPSAYEILFVARDHSEADLDALADAMIAVAADLPAALR